MTTLALDIQKRWAGLNHSGAASGVLLVIAAALAMLIANSPLAAWYDLLLKMPVEVRVGPLEVAKPLLLWINDGLMAIFFFLVGLELKKELLEGDLRDIRKVALPAAGAVGGMLVPAAIYIMFNYGDADAMSGWAIPAATDIAFALGILMLVGSGVPTALKVFLVSLAIIDDIGAILIIALFYTSELSLTALAVALPCLVVLFMLNRRGVTQTSPYILVGLVMWLAVLKSGVHATLAGVLLAFFIPLRNEKKPEHSPLHEMEENLKNTVGFGILPIFAFANAGISLDGVGLDAVMHPIPMGIAAGLFIGKQLGVMSFCWLAVRTGLASIPQGVNWLQLYGAALLSGVGFTMSLFIGSLAFESTGVDHFFDERLGILIGSFLSGAFGFAILRRAIPRQSPNKDGDPTSD